MPKNLDWKGYEGADYEQFWLGRQRQLLDEFEQKIFATLLSGGKAIAEVGGGFGRLAPTYLDKYETSHLVEPASNLRDDAQKEHPGLKCHDASAEKLPFEDGELDTVIMCRVFHHFHNPDAAVKEVARVVRKGGQYVFNYSNKKNIRRLIGGLLKFDFSIFDHSAKEYYVSLFGHHPGYVEKLLAKHGFRIKAIYGAGVMDRIVAKIPLVPKGLSQSLFFARLGAAFGISPANFIVAERV